jgi:hypothetical protein
MQSHTFAGGDVYLPNAVEDYLEGHYGDWQTPQEEWSLSHVKSSTVFKSQIQ